MEYKLKKSALKVQAPDKASAAKYLRAMAPRLGGTTISDVEEIKSEQNKIMGIWIPEEESSPVLMTSLKVLAWDSCDGIRLAIVASPSGDLYWVDTESRLIISNSPATIPNKKDIQTKKRKLYSRVHYAPMEIPECEFWRKVRS